jgi:hypothetical protein
VDSSESTPNLHYVNEQDSRVRQTFSMALGLVLIGAGAVGVWLIVRSLFSNPGVAGPVIAASVALAVFAGGEFFTRRRVAQQYRWDKVAPTYGEFVGLMRKIAKQTEATGEPPADLLEFMGRFTDLLILWGSPEIIKAWVDMHRHLESGYEDEREVIVDWAKMLLAIRKDLGHGDRKLDTRDLLKITITDVDQHLGPGATL